MPQNLHIFVVWKLKTQVFYYFMLLYFFPNECPGLCCLEQKHLLFLWSAMEDAFVCLNQRLKSIFFSWIFSNAHCHITSLRIAENLNSDKGSIPARSPICKCKARPSPKSKYPRPLETRTLQKTEGSSPPEARKFEARPPLVMGRVRKSRVRASPSLKKSSPIESESWLV